jgi:hypothetical protein
MMNRLNWWGSLSIYPPDIVKQHIFTLRMNQYFSHKYTNWLVPLLCIGLAFLHGIFWYSASSGRDDVYITYWAAQALSEFGQIINYNGEALEQSSSLLHVILLAVLHKLSGISMPVLGVFFSATMGALTILAAWRLAIFLKLPSAWFVALFLALFPYLVYWSFGGLETSLVALIVVLLIYSVIRLITEKLSLSIFLLAFLSICAYIMARPEAILVILAFLFGIAFYFVIDNVIVKKSSHFFYGKKDFQKLMILVSISLVIFALLSLWRYQTFGQIFPQSVYAKSSGLNWNTFISGFHYLFDHYWIPSIVFLTVLTGFGLYKSLLYQHDNRNRLAFVIIISFIIATITFTVFSGGDWMEGGRFLVPILPLLAISGLLAVCQNDRSVSGSGWTPVHKIVLISLALLAILDTTRFLSAEKNGPISIPQPLAEAVYRPVLQHFELSEQQDFSWFELANREHLRDNLLRIMLDRVVTRLLVVQQKPITVVANHMGMIPFYLSSHYFGKVKFMDLRGLITTDFLDCEMTRDLPKGQMGLLLSEDYLFTHFEEISEQCFSQPPAIIYGWGGKAKIKQVEKYGYKTVYAHSTWISTGGCWTRQKVWAGQYLAVREDLLNLVGDLETIFYEWPTIGNEKCSW